MIYPDYDKLWESMEISNLPKVKNAAKLILNGIARYKKVVEATVCPWQFIGITHYRESGCNFKTHPHNGDSLLKRTVNVPKGRPLSSPPFTWEQSAVDCYFSLKHLDEVEDWSVSNFLKLLEQFNGVGYIKYHPDVLSPYLWSGTNLYTKGKYKSDGVFDKDLVDKQIGGAPILSLINGDY